MKINFRLRATVAPMPEPAAVKAEQPPKRKRSKSRITPDPVITARRTREFSDEARARQSIGAKLAAFRRWGALNITPGDEIPPDLMPAVVKAVETSTLSNPQRIGQAQRIDSSREVALTVAAEASPRIVQAMTGLALDPSQKAGDRVAASRVVLQVAGLLDGQAASKRAGDDGDPRDLDAGGLRRLALSAQARLSALEAAADSAAKAESLPSDATSGGQAAQATDAVQESAQQSAPAAGLTPEPFE